MSHDGAYVARASAAPPLSSGGGNHGHDSGLSSTPAPNDFARASQYGSQDGFSSGGATGAGAPHHWSHQPSPYGASSGYAANQFAAPPAPQHHGYPSSTASPYAFAVGSGGGGTGVTGGPYQSHTSPYSFANQQHQQHPHHRAAPYPSSYANHESGPPATNGAAPGNFPQHAVSGSTAGAVGVSPAYHSPGVAGLMSSGIASHGSANAGHQGGYAPHYGTSAGPPGGPMPSSVSQSQSMGAPGYPSVPQYSTQLPLAGRHRVTTTLWEDEGTLCFQVDARGVCVARRHDNSMINGTKLLNVCGMSRGKRDGILKNEKERIVVKVGAMHLKGVWITFQRGKQLAEQNGIADVLYPLFEPNIQSFLYHPDNYPRTQAVMAAAQERQAARKSGGLPGPGPASGLDMGAGPAGIASSMLSGSSQDSDYPGGPAGVWNAHHAAPQQQQHYRHPVTNGTSYLSSAPVSATHSPAHHTHSGYSTTGSGMMQSHNVHQSSMPLSNHTSAMRPTFSNHGDRRQSNSLEAGSNFLEHPSRMENPYAMSSHHSSIDNGLPSSGSSSTNSNGPSTATTLQSLPGIGSVGQRRTFSAASFKRGYNDDDSVGGGGGGGGGSSSVGPGPGHGPGGNMSGGGPPNGHSSSSYEGVSHSSSSGMGGGSSGDFYGGGGGAERSFKRPRESGISRGGGGVVGGGVRGQDDSYDTSGEYGVGAGQGGHGGSNGNGMEKRGSGPTV